MLLNGMGCVPSFVALSLSFAFPHLAIYARLYYDFHVSVTRILHPNISSLHRLTPHHTTPPHLSPTIHSVARDGQAVCDSEGGKRGEKLVLTLRMKRAKVHRARKSEMEARRIDKDVSVGE